MDATLAQLVSLARTMGILKSRPSHNATGKDCQGCTFDLDTRPTTEVGFSPTMYIIVEGKEV